MEKTKTVSDISSIISRCSGNEPVDPREQQKIKPTMIMFFFIIDHDHLDHVEILRSFNLDSKTDSLKV